MSNNPFSMFGEMFADIVTPRELREEHKRIAARLAMGPEGDKLSIAEDWTAIGNDMRKTLDSLGQHIAGLTDTLDYKEEE